MRITVLNIELSVHFNASCSTTKELGTLYLGPPENFRSLIFVRFMQDTNKTSTEVNRRQVQITTSDKTIEKLRKAIADGTADKEKLEHDKEKAKEEFKKIEAKAFVIQEKLTSLQEV